jgi:hypothetical protein
MVALWFLTIERRRLGKKLALLTCSWVPDALGTRAFSDGEAVAARVT